MDGWMEGGAGGMPEPQRVAPVTVRDLVRLSAAGRRLVAVTAYTAPEARLCDAAGVDVILVGDSLGNAVLGLADTLGVTMDDMVRHTRAVAGAAQRALVVADLPFLSYQTGIADAVRNGGRLLQAGASAVKLEGGSAYVPTVEALGHAGIPVIGHLGFTPQSVRRLGGPRVQGRESGSAEELRRDAAALAAAGVGAIVLEMVPGPLAQAVTAEVSVPTIGIGAGPDCSGQILVLYDLVGLSPRLPHFARSYGDAGAEIGRAVERYAEDVRAGRFPGPEHTHDGRRWGEPHPPGRDAPS